jgi:predicted O-linked N-acetylglucosamine transferase (SPINDLY family)
MDFRITDPIADPPGEDEAFHSEILMRLPAGFLCYRPLDAAPEVAPSPACDTGVITFGSFNTLPKLNERVASIWSEILGKVPGSRLLLKTKQLADPGARNYVFSLFRRFGIHEERITLLPRTPDSRDHLSCYNQVDIGLDPFPYNGTTTTCEALWMGVPVVTLRGSRHAARVGASLLSGMRLTKLVAENEKNYVATAVDLASDIKRLAGIRADLRGLMAASPLCNAGAFARNMEEAFHNIWAIHSVNKETSDETVRAPYTISLPENFEKIPEERWASLLSPPECFHKSGEAETYARFVGRLTTGLHRNLSKKPDSPYWRRASRIFLEKANFIPLYFSRLSLTDIYRQRSEIAQTVLSRSGYRLQPSSLHRRSEGKIRLGVHFRGIRPGTEAYAAFPIFANLDRDRFEVYLYVHHTDGNSLEKEAWKLADQFRILPESLNASVQLIREDRLDLLFFSGNTTAVTNESFILSCHRMARFQGVHFASPTTTGHSTVDFFLLGRDVASGCRPGSFTERVLEVEGSGICFHPEVLLPRARGEGVRERLGIPASAKLYVSGANFYKILPELREAWAELISQVPGSLMVLYPFGPSWSAHYPRDAFVSDLRKTFSKKEVSPDRLIVLDSFARREEIAELLAASNVYLDAIPYSGATSLLDPLSQNLPLVVCEGNELRFRQGGAMLRQLEIPELVVPDRESYLRLAAELGRDPALQDYFREKIRSRMNNTPLFLDMTAYGKFVGETLSALVQANG